MLTDTERRVLKLVREYDGISRKEIAKSLHLSKPVVSDAVAQLISKGYVREDGIIRSPKARAGRPRIRLSFVPDARYCIGIELEERNFEAVLANLDGDVKYSLNVSLPRLNSEEGLSEWIAQRIFDLVEKSRVLQEKILGIGVGIAGIVDSKSDVVRAFPALGFRDFDLKRTLEEKTHMDVFISNRVNVDALSEQRIGAAKNKRDVLLLFIDSGIGSGILIDGEVFEGSYGKAGEIGWFVTDWSKENAFDKSEFGYLAQWASGHCLEWKMKKAKKRAASLDKAFSSLGSNEKIGKMIEEGFTHLALALANAILFFDPEIVVIKGRIGLNHYHEIVKIMLPVLKRVLPKEFQENLVFTRGVVKRYGVALGAAFLVQQKVLKM